MAWVHYSLPKYLRTEAFQPHSPDPEALFICCLVVSEKWRKRGVGEQLLQAVVEEARERGIRAVETIGRRGSSSNPAGPIELYTHNGFTVRREHPEFPLLRLSIS